MTTIVTFDVDGTLVTSEGKNANRLHKLAFGHAWRTVFSFEADIDEVPHHVRRTGCTNGLDAGLPGTNAHLGSVLAQGMTDPSILVLLSETHGIPKEQARLPQNSLRHPGPCAGRARWKTLLSVSYGTPALGALTDPQPPLHGRSDVPSCAGSDEGEGPGDRDAGLL